MLERREGLMRTSEGLGSVGVMHPLDPEDASIISRIRTAARPQKGMPLRIEAPKPYDALLEGVSPRDDVTFEPGTVGDVPGLWSCREVCQDCLPSAFTSATTKCCSMTHDDTSNVPSPPVSMPGSTCGRACHTDLSPSSERSRPQPRRWTRAACFSVRGCRHLTKHFSGSNRS